MIGRLTGVAIEKGVDGQCVLDVRGVGYEVMLPLRTLSRLPGSPERVTLHIHTHVREDVLRLYAFESALDRLVFRALLGISGVGPKLAMALLSELTAAEVSAAIARGDKKRLSAVSGIGAKLAARLLLELKDKLPTVLATDVAWQSPATAQALGRAGEVAAALFALGFSRSQAETAAAKVVVDEDARPVETLVRQALSTLG